MNSDFIEVCESPNRRIVRIKLGNIITIDPALVTFREMKSYAERHITDLYDVHSGDLNADKSAWTKDYYNEQQTELSFNFSRERLQLLCDMATYLYGGPGGRINAINENRERERNANKSQTVTGGAVLGGGGSTVIGDVIEAVVGGGNWRRHVLRQRVKIRSVEMGEPEKPENNAVVPTYQQLDSQSSRRTSLSMIES